MPTHTIVAGDTFWALSVQYGCNLDDTLGANLDVNPTQFQVGQVIPLPDNINRPNYSSDVIFHTIVKDDTFWQLSQQYGCRLDAILAANSGVIPEQLQIGQVVPIPGHQGPTHTIRPGDTFWLVSQQYRCSLDEILAVNPDVVPERLQTGQVVRLPDRVQSQVAHP